MGKKQVRFLVPIFLNILSLSKGITLMAKMILCIRCIECNFKICFKVYRKCGLPTHCL